MSIEGFLLKRKRFRTKHNMYQLIADDEHFDLDVAMDLLKAVSDAVEEDGRELDSGELWTIVPPGYRWQLVK